MRRLYLDLEDTIVTPNTKGWQEVVEINHDIVKAIAKKMDEVNIFSFALHDQRQLDLWKMYCQEWLERVLEVQFKDIPTVDMGISAAVCRQRMIHPLHLSFEDLVTFYGKESAFEMYCLDMWITGKFPDAEETVVLLDDTVKFTSFKSFRRPNQVLNLVFLNPDLRQDLDLIVQ